LPPYSSDLKSIEMAFAKLKALLRAKAVRTIGRICDLFDPQNAKITPPPKNHSCQLATR
jgi:transposase